MCARHRNAREKSPQNVGALLMRQSQQPPGMCFCLTCTRMLSISLAYCLLLSLALTLMRLSSHLMSLVRSQTDSARIGRSCNRSKHAAQQVSCQQHSCATMIVLPKPLSASDRVCRSATRTLADQRMHHETGHLPLAALQPY